jgi:hypothetical protein
VGVDVYVGVDVLAGASVGEDVLVGVFEGIEVAVGREGLVNPGFIETPAKAQ